MRHVKAETACKIARPIPWTPASLARHMGFGTLQSQAYAPRLEAITLATLLI